MTVIYSDECVSARKASNPTAVLPLLIILFVISYCILTMLVFEQGQTIESQRTLIREMLKDSSQLATLKNKLAHDAQDRISQEKDKASLPANANSSNPAASPKALDKGTKDGKRPSKSARVTKDVPVKPESDLEDVRRSTRVI